MKNKALAIEALKKADGLGTEIAIMGGKPNCAIGWLFAAMPEMQKEKGVYDGIEHFYMLDWGSVARENDNFIGSPEERRDHMIEWLSRRPED